MTRKKIDRPLSEKFQAAINRNWAIFTTLGIEANLIKMHLPPEAGVHVTVILTHTAAILKILRSKPRG